MEYNLIPYQAVGHVARGRVLVLAPHPDDEVFGCGGAIMRHVEQGDPVHVIIVTDGGHGVEPADRAAYIHRRREESRAAAAVMACPEPEFWGVPDRELDYGEALVGRVVQAIRAFAADLIYAPSVFEVHPDHRALALAAVEAVGRAGDPVTLVMYEVGVPLRPNRLLDISGLKARKREAMACFTSQLQRQNYLDHVEALNRFRTYTLGPEVQAAEAYRLIDGTLDAGWLAACSPERIDRIFDGFGRQRGELLARIGQLEQELATCRVMLERAEDRTNRIYQSRSWRLTAPIRWLKRRILMHSDT